MFTKSSLIVLILIPISIQAQLNQRPLRLPTVKDRAPCPVTKRSVISVDKNIFCSFCLWFGNGPVYFSLPLADCQHGDDASFKLDPTIRDSYGYEIKLPWVTKPNYLGPILVRGQKLDNADSDTIHFWPVFGWGESGDPSVREELKLTSPNHQDPTHWSFWPSTMILSGEGCYGLQIDTAVSSDVVIFRATTNTSDRHNKSLDTSRGSVFRMKLL